MWLLRKLIEIFNIQFGRSEPTGIRLTLARPPTWAIN
jgi:hypothetical protein